MTAAAYRRSDHEHLSAAPGGSHDLQSQPLHWWCQTAHNVSGELCNDQEITTERKRTTANDDVDYDNDDQSVDWVNDWLIDWWWWLCAVQVLSLKAQYCILGEFVKGNWRIWERVGVIQFSLSVINVFSFRITFRISVLVCTCVLSGAGHLFLLLNRIIVTTLKKLLPGGKDGKKLSWKRFYKRS